MSSKKEKLKRGNKAKRNISEHENIRITSRSPGSSIYKKRLEFSDKGEQELLWYDHISYLEHLKLKHRRYTYGVSVTIEFVAEKTNSRVRASNASQGFDDLEKLVFSEDGSCLLFDEHFLPCKQSSCPDIVSIDRIAHVLSSNQYQNGVEVDPEALLSWIFTSPLSVEQLASGTRAREEKAQQGVEIFPFLEKGFYDSGGTSQLCDIESGEEDDWRLKRGVA